MINYRVNIVHSFTTMLKNRPHIVFCLLVLLNVLLPVSSRPQAYRVEADGTAVDERWETPKAEQEYDEETQKRDDVIKTLLQRAIMDVLETLPEEDLRLLEELPRDDLPQGDMPAEDTVDDQVQELPAEDTVNSDLEGYKGELVVLDNINSTLGNVTEGSLDEASYPQAQKIARERNKELRLHDIKHQILSYLFKGPPPVFPINSTNYQLQQEIYNSVREKMRNQKTQFPPGEVYTEKVQSFYPSCVIPRNTDEDLWAKSETMNLWFDLSPPPALQGTSVSIVAAKLRLYKLSQDNVTVVVPEVCPPPMYDDSGEVSKPQKFHFTFPSPPFVEDKQIRVSIYWYTRSLKKNRVKRKLLDSQMLSIYGEAWTEWNIRGAVKAWRESGRNFGLAIEVEDEDGTLLPANKYFTPMNCSKQASIGSPIPGFLARAIAKGTNKTILAGKSNPYHFNTLLFPIIDLCTIESPESEKTSYYHKIQDEAGRVYPVLFPAPKKENATFILSSPLAINETDKHRIRHHHHHNEEIKPRKHLETIRRDDGESIEEITWEDDIDGHQLRKHIIEQKIIKKAHKYQDENDR